MSVYLSPCWVEIPRKITISQLMQRNIENTPPEKIIFEEALSGKTVTYGSFHNQTRTTAQLLRDKVGLRPGQIVSILSSSRIDCILTAHAVWWAGGIVSLINNALSVDEIRHAVDMVEPTFVVIDETLFQKLPEVLRISTQHQKRPLQVYTIGPGSMEWPELPMGSRSVSIIGEPSHQEGPWSLDGKRSDEVCAAVLLSSGTTGSPKAVMLSHYNIVAICNQLRSDNPDNWRGGQREIFFPPLSHVYALYSVFTTCVWVGAFVCLMPRFDLRRYCQLMQDRKATLARLVPPVAKMLAENAVVKQYQYPFLEYFSCSAAPLHPDLATKLKQAFPGVALCQTYGCTELSGPNVQSGVRDVKLPPTAAGTPIANTEIRFLDEDGKDVGARGPGEITCRGPNVMMGYKQAGGHIVKDFFEDGWYRTGDLGYIDDDGFLFVYDRIKDVIKYKGFQVSPSELERILLQYPLVDEAVVIGIWHDDEATEVPRAFVTLKKKLDSDPGEEDKLTRSVAEFVDSKVSSYKRLRGGVVVLHELPKNTTGKVLRRELKARSRSGLRIGTPRL
ncbi:L-aminoadipate-semialdehyde dehydrogenase [Fonsecaea erecta]|uniref:L-aminoadipate-semialdehyde dehydrogenase n=1 Tax=Fonsecaea erecta TaxID=1367422 RepID=A0A178ZWK1_9EURO|nr:L-aminoadipate-semialdehyde dehydrogenase [Fonsecaea erecta]OAP64210.1 L-aminoadipate-semialdehyde dehydrogenase [Fonsecaea erecta]